MKQSWIIGSLLVIASTGISKLFGENFTHWPTVIPLSASKETLPSIPSAEKKNLPATDSCFQSGKHYAILPNTATAKPQLIEFFSFYCTQCYAFQHKYQISEALAANLPPGGQFKQYHVALFGPLAKELTRAWAVAMVLGIEKKINPILFAGIQENASINSSEDIRQAFIQAGIPAQEYDGFLHSFLVNSLVFQQEQAIQEAKLRGIPSLLVNKKYRVHPENFSMKEGIQGFTQQYLRLVKQLSAAVEP